MGFPHQEEIDKYYEVKKKEVGEWLERFADEQKRLTKEQRQRIHEYAENMSFTNAGYANGYVQGLSTVGKRNKEKLYAYMAHVDWLPDNVTTGIIDGKIVSRILPSPLERLFGDKEWKSKKE
jgi:DNA-directed RNA polymerase subunit F